MDLEIAKDGIILIAGGGVIWRLVLPLVSKLFKSDKGSQTVTVNAGNSSSNSTHHGTNGRVYATQAELSNHALTCAGAIHEKINQNYQALSGQINSNHKESMQVFADIRVDIAKLQSLKRGE